MNISFNERMKLYLMEHWKLKYIFCKQKQKNYTHMIKLINKGKKMLKDDFNLKEIIKKIKKL